MAGQVDIKSLWDKVVDEIKMKVIHPTLWKTLEQTVAITIDNGQLVVGVPSVSYHLSGHLSTSDHKNAIEKSIRTLTGQNLSLRVIEGETMQDWLAVKAKDEHIREMREASSEKKRSDAAIAKAWENLFEMAGRRYANLPLRGLPQNKAKYIAEMLKRISDTMDDLMPEGTPTDEVTERSLARVIERVAVCAESPAAWIAVELARYRAQKKRT